MQEFFQLVLFQIGDFEFRLASLLLGMVVAGFWALIRYVLLRLIFRQWLNDEHFDRDKKKLRRITTGVFLNLFLLAIMSGSGILIPIYEDISVKTLLQAILIWQLARLLDLTFSIVLKRRVLHREEEAQKKKGQQTILQGGTRMVQSVVYILAINFLLQYFPSLNINLFPPEASAGGRELDLLISDVFVFILIILSARLVIWVIIHLFLDSYYQNREIDAGSRFAINQLLKYFIYVTAIITGLQFIGFNLTLIWGGAAALLVGVGLGLQQTFNDLFSGIVLLTERSVQVGDVVDLQGLVGTVKRIGIRTSEVLTRNNVIVVVPNSRLIVEKVVNWSHNDKKARFYVTVGVAYGSDTQLVKELLLKAARSHKSILGYPSPFVRFVDFGNSSLDFELHFYSREFIRIEDVKSDLRFEIDQHFRDNEVTIPFPQQDVWFRNPMPRPIANGRSKAPEEPSTKTEGDAHPEDPRPETRDH